jgi:hypothetical protein
MGTIELGVALKNKGTDTTDATATAEDIASGKTAYVASGKVTGTKEETEQNVEFSDSGRGPLKNIYNSGDYLCNINLYIKKIKVPNNISSLYNIGTFNNKYFPKLETLILPEGITYIPQQMCSNNTSLKTVVLPKTITKIDYNAFYKCSNLSDIYYRGTEEEWGAITKDSEWDTNMGSMVGGTTIHYNYTD